MTRLLPATGFTLLVLSAAVFGQQPRDPVGRESVGTATISGTVLSDDSQPRPLRRARVTLNGPELPVGQTTITADDGSFSFVQLPAGRYMVSASKEGYVAMNFGARRPLRPGVRVIVGQNEARRVSVRLPRGAVITGTLSTDQGQPLAGVNIYAMRYAFSPETGGRRLVPLAGGFSPITTDDRGVYRIYGLAAGEYAIAAQAGPGSAQFRMWAGAEVISPAEIRAALAAVRDSARAMQPRMTSPSVPALEAVEPRGRVRLAHVYYPGTALASRATLLKVAAGEERTGVDFSMEYVPTATVEGYVAPVDPTMRVSVTLTTDAGSVPVEGREGRPADAEGRFAFSGVPPGSYTVMAHAMPRAQGAGNPSQTLFGSTQITVAGHDISGLALALTPGLTISGQLKFEGSQPPSIDFTRLRAPFLPASTGHGFVPLPAPRFEADGRFTLTGITPGQYVLYVEPPGLRSPVGGWWLKSVTAGGRELLDGPLELRESAADAVMVFSDNANTLTGIVPNASGPTDGHVIVFAMDPKYWFVSSRRIAVVRPDEEGRYSIRNLPPGDYFAAAVEDVANREWFDPEFLQQLAPRAARVKMAAEPQTLDLVWLKQP